LTSQIEPIKAQQKKKSEFLNRITALDTDLSLPNPRRTPSQNAQDQKASDIIWNSAAKHLPRRYSKSKTYGSDEYATAFSSYLRGAQMSGSEGMSVSNDERGGYFVTSEAFSSEIVKNVDDSVYIQSLSRVIMVPPGTQSYNIRTRRAKASSFTFEAAENRDMADQFDTSLKYGKRTMTPNWLTGSCIISKELIRSYPGAEQMVIDELAINASEILEQKYLYGTGNMQPLGLLTANADGITTDRDTTTTLTANFDFDDFVKIKYSLKPKYRRNATWMLHRLMLQNIALLKDGEGQYLWQPSRQIGSPDTILGLPFVESEWMPSALSSDAYFTILGDFQWYYVMWEMSMQLQRLAEMRAYTNEYEYLFRAKVDAQPILEEAFARGIFA
jgi:HK97 family phage major capsid protein